MKTVVLSKCGYRCDLCLAYAPNVAEADRRRELSDGWHRIFGFRIEPDEIICEGCVSSESPVLIDKKCPVRPCAVERRLEHCGQCPDFICDRHRQREVSRKDIEERLGKKISDSDYELFVKPYESVTRLRSMSR